MGSRGDGSSMGERLPRLEIHSGLGTIIEDLVNPGFQLRAPLLHYLQSLQGILQLCDGSGSDEGRIEVVVLDGPGDGQVGQFIAEFFFCEVGECLETGDNFGLGESLVEDTLEEFVREVLVLVIEPIDFFLSDALKMSSGKEATGKGAPGNKPVLVILIETKVLDLIFSPLEHVILILSTDRLVEVQPLTGIQGIQHHLCIPVGSGPI